MTYRELALAILSEPEEVQNQTVTLFVPGVDEYYPATTAMTDESCDVLDPNHLVLTID
jgi:hypothetical protein